MTQRDSEDFQQWLNDHQGDSQYLEEIEEAGTDLKQLLEEYPKVIQD